MESRGSRVAFVLAAAGVLASLAGCGAGDGAASRGTGPSAPTVTPVVPRTTPLSTAAPTPAASSLTVLAPRAVIDIPSVPGAIQVTAERTAEGEPAVWTNGDGRAWRVDTATNAATAVPIDIDGSSWTSVAIHDGDLWGADFHRGRILRVDPATGRVVATFDALRPTALTPGRGGLWFAHELGGDISHIDVKRNRIDKDIRPALGLGGTGSDIWFTRDTSTGSGREAVDADAVTGAEKRVVPIPDGVGCSFFADVQVRLWTWCTPSADSTTVAVIDMATWQVTSFVSDRSWIGGLVEAGGETWALVGATQDEPAVVIELGANGPTGVGAALPAGVDPDWSVVADGSIWIPSDGTGKLYRFDDTALTALR